MKQFTLALIACFVAGSVLFAQEKKEEKMEMKKEAKPEMKKEAKMDMAGSHTMTGWLVDQMCGKKMGSGDAEKSKAKAMKHTKDCALEEACAESGFGLVHDGMWNKFDEKGDKMALDWLKKTDMKSNLMVEVKGTMDGTNIKVESITPVVEKKMEKKEEKKEKS